MTIFYLFSIKQIPQKSTFFYAVCHVREYAEKNEKRESFYGKMGYVCYTAIYEKKV